MVEWVSMSEGLKLGFGPVDMEPQNLSACRIDMRR